MPGLVPTMPLPSSGAQPEPTDSLTHPEAWLSVTALVAMVLVAVAEILLRPSLGIGVPNSASVVQHLGLVATMMGAVAAHRGGHLPNLPLNWPSHVSPKLAARLQGAGHGLSSVLAGVLATGSLAFVVSDWDASKDLLPGLPVSWVVLAMPLGLWWLAVRFAAQTLPWWLAPGPALLGSVLALSMGLGLDQTQLPALSDLAQTLQWRGSPASTFGALVLLIVALVCGAPLFLVLGGLALVLFWSDDQPLSAIALSHYQIVVNPSLPALPLFTLAGLLFATGQSARRIADVFSALFGTGLRGTAIAAAVLCSAFTALTGGSGVTILALGGLLLPLLRHAGMPQQRGIGLVTSASALGVLLAPSVPLIMYAVIARVPMTDMFLAGLLPALVMVVCLLALGGFIDPTARSQGQVAGTPEAAGHYSVTTKPLLSCLLDAKFELAAPLVAVGSLGSGLATPTESAALTAIYAWFVTCVWHRELSWLGFWHVALESARAIGGVMLMLGMALGLTNYLIDAGIPDAAVQAVQHYVPNRWAFLLLLNLFLLLAGALMEIFAALVVLVPLLLPIALAYGLDPIHFGIIFLANLELGFLCPPAGMNIFFASAMFRQPIKDVAGAVLRPALAILVGALIISLLPELSLALPRWLGSASTVP